MVLWEGWWYLQSRLMSGIKLEKSERRFHIVQELAWTHDLWKGYAFGFWLAYIELLKNNKWPLS